METNTVGPNQLKGLQRSWLTDFLNSHNWQIPACAALTIAKLLVKAKLLAKKDVGLDAYYRDVRVWLSEIQYGCMVLPPCPYCCMHEQACSQALMLTNQPRCLVLRRDEDDKTPHESAIHNSLHEMRNCRNAAVEVAKASQCKIVSVDLCQFILMTVALQGLGRISMYSVK